MIVCCVCISVPCSITVELWLSGCLIIWMGYCMYAKMHVHVMSNCFKSLCICWTHKNSHILQRSALFYEKPNFNCIRECQLLQKNKNFKWIVVMMFGFAGQKCFTHCCNVLYSTLEALNEVMSVYTKGWLARLMMFLLSRCILYRNGFLKMSCLEGFG